MYYGSEWELLKMWNYKIDASIFVLCLLTQEKLDGWKVFMSFPCLIFNEFMEVTFQSFQICVHT